MGESNPSAKRRRRFILLTAVLLTAAGTAGGIYWKKREKPVTVQTERVTRRNLTELVTATGKVQPVVQVVIQPEVSGEIVDLPVKEGQAVRKGELLVSIKPNNYIAQRNSGEASYRSALANRNLARANLDKAELDFKRVQELHQDKLVSDSQFLEAKTALAVMQASYETSTHQADMAKAALARMEDDLAKTTIKAPTDGIVTKLRVQQGERVVGTAMMAGTEIMTVARLDEMEARVDIGEVDVVLISVGQKTRLEVDSFRDRKFTGVVSEIANAAKTSGLNTPQEATKFEVRIRIQETEGFRPGMSVTSEIETRYRTNVLTVPIQSVTLRLPKGLEEEKKKKRKPDPDEDSGGDPKPRKREAPKAEEVVFEVRDGQVHRLPVKRGIADNDYVEILEGVSAGQEIVSGGYKAITRELDENRRVTVDNTRKSLAPSPSN